MTGKIVVATDGSDAGNRAVDFAATMSNKLEKTLYIVHVLMHGRPTKEFMRMAEVEGLIPPAQKQDTSAQSTNRAALFPGVKDEVSTARAVAALGENIVDGAKRRSEELGAEDVQPRICAGDIADEILDIADAEKADVIVIGRRGLGRVREALLGSVSQKVLHHSDCTVVIVP